MDNNPMRTKRPGAMSPLVMTVLLAAGAGAGPTRPERPAWIDAPGNGVSASAGMHVRAQVKAKWHDPVADGLWIWLVPAGE